MTFTNEKLSSVMIAISSGDCEWAARLVAEEEQISDELRAQLITVIDAGGEPGTVLTNFADALRTGGSSNRGEINELHRAAFYAGDQWVDLARNPLFAYFLAARSALGLDKWIHYFEIYDMHLSRFRGTDVKVLEIGTFKGGGLAMLREYLGPQAQLVGMDIDPVAVASIRDQFTVVLGDQEDPESLRRISEEFGPFDVVIEDGGHTMKQQIITAETLFPLLNDGAVYLSEDLHTSYWEEYGGGLKSPDTFIEWIKDRVDDINGYHAGTGHGGSYGTTDYVNNWTRTVGGLHLYDSVVVMDKKRVAPPFAELSGTFHYLRENRFEASAVVDIEQARDMAVNELNRVRAENEEELTRVRAENEQGLNKLERRQAKAEAELRQLKESKSWQLTKPLRRFRSR